MQAEEDGRMLVQHRAQQAIEHELVDFQLIHGAGFLRARLEISPGIVEEIRLVATQAAQLHIRFQGIEAHLFLRSVKRGIALAGMDPVVAGTESDVAAIEFIPAVSTGPGLHLIAVEFVLVILQLDIVLADM